MQLVKVLSSCIACIGLVKITNWFSEEMKLFHSTHYPMKGGVSVFWFSISDENSRYWGRGMHKKKQAERGETKVAN